MKTYILWCILLIAFAFHSGAQTPMRLKTAVSFHKGGIADSTVYYYSQGRGSIFNYNELRYTYSSYTIGGGKGVYSRFFGQVAVPLDNLDSASLENVKFDSAVNYTSSSIQNYYYDLKETRHYDHLDRCSEDAIFGNPIGSGNIGRAVKLFGNGKLNKIFLLSSAVGGGWDTVSARSLYYDTNERLVFDSLSNKTRPIYYRFTYGTGPGFESAVRVDSSAPLPDPKTIEYYKTYYSDGKLKTTRQEYRHPFLMIFKDSFGYTPGVDGFTYHMVEYRDSIQIKNRSHSQCVRYNSNGQQDSVAFYGGLSAPFVWLAAKSAYYDSLGNPVSVNYYDRGTSGIYSGERYYYEAITPLSINAIATPTTFCISPNPTTGIVVVHHPDLKSSTPLTIVITNATGQPIRSESFNARSTSSSINLGTETPPGIYYISVNDHSGRAPTTKQFLKL